MPAPTITPAERDPATIAPTDSYRPADTVWVYRRDAWCAGAVMGASPHAATIKYRPGTSRGTSVDTVTAPYLYPRNETDPVLDQPTPTPHGSNPRLEQRRVS